MYCELSSHSRFIGYNFAFSEFLSHLYENLNDTVDEELEYSKE